MSEATLSGSPSNAAGAESSRRRAFSFGRASKIKSSRRFQEVFASPDKRVGRFVVVWSGTGTSESGESRLGIVASKRTFRHAVERNRAKRLIRESFRQIRPEFAGPPRDFVVIAKRRILEAKCGDVREDMRKAMTPKENAEC